MDIGTVAEAMVATATAGGVAWALGKWIIGPHLRETIKETVTETVGPQLAEVPTLTTAVTELTGAIREQNRDTSRLTNGLDELRVEVHGLRDDFGQLAERTATLEGAAAAKPKRARQRRRIA